MTLLLKYWPHLLGLLVLVTFIGLFVYRGNRIEVLTARLETADLQLAEQHESIKTLRSSLTEQNAAVDALRSAADARLAQANKALAAAETSRNLANLKAKRLLDAQAQLGVDNCVAANDLINEILK